MTEPLIQLPQMFGRVLAIRYGDANGDLDDGAVSRIAQFVLGHDVDTRVTVLNERMMDVVQPIKEFWDPAKGVADLEVTDTKSGLRLALGLGGWLARYPTGRLRALTHSEMIAQHFPPPPPKTFRHELAEILNKHSKDAEFKTPDFILARYLEKNLEAFHLATVARDGWNGRS